MKATRITLLVLSIIANSAFAADFAETSFAAEMTKLIQRTNLQGWSGIYFVCESQAFEAAETICSNAKVDASFLAAAVGVKLTVVDSSLGDFLEEGVRQQNLLLTLKIVSTQPGTPAAMAITLEAAAATPGNLIDRKPQEYWPGKNLAGKLAIWSRDAIGASSGEALALVPSMRDSVETLLKEFLAAFATASQ